MPRNELPTPPQFKEDLVGKVWKTDYQETARLASEWRKQHGVRPASEDRQRTCLLLVDVQNTFCIPDFELFVAGSTGRGAVEDNIRLCRFIYRNLASITQVVPTLDTHQSFQIFHPIFLVDANGQHPKPNTRITVEEIEDGRWSVNPEAAWALGRSVEELNRHCLHYARQLRQSSRLDWIIWPYHSMLGGIGHALVSSVEQAVFFHEQCRFSPARFEIKGSNPLTEHYSVLGPEIDRSADGQPIGSRNRKLVESLAGFDRVIVAGQAKSHCVAWTVRDLLNDPEAGDIAGRLYLLDDCTSPVVVPGGPDFTADADQAFDEFRKAGVHLVHSTEPISQWPAT